MGCIFGLVAMGAILWVVTGLDDLLTPIIGETAADGVMIVSILAILCAMGWYNRRAQTAHSDYDHPTPSSGIGGLLAVVVGAFFGFAMSRHNRRDR